MPRLRRLDPVYFRLLERAPLAVAFPSITYELFLDELDVSEMNWTLKARPAGSVVAQQVSELFWKHAWIEEALYEIGFATRHATIGETIMLRLVREKRAEALPWPERHPSLGRGQPWNVPAKAHDRAKR